MTHRPWKGDLYAKLATRLLILGESHHGDHQTDMTQTAVDGWRDGETNRSYAFFTKLAVMLTDQRPWELDRKAAFAPIAFHNYVQRVVEGSRVSAFDLDREEAEPVFFRALEELQPTHLIVLGKETLRSRPFRRAFKGAKSVTLHDHDALIGRFERPYGVTLAMPMRHPSTGYNGHHWHPRCRAFLGLSAT